MKKDPGVIQRDYSPNISLSRATPSLWMGLLIDQSLGTVPYALTHFDATKPPVDDG